MSLSVTAATARADATFGSSTVTCASFTPAVGEWLFVEVGGGVNAAVDVTWTIQDTQSGSWSQVVIGNKSSTGSSTNGTGVAVFWRPDPVTSATSMTITATISATGASIETHTLQPYRVSAAGIVGIGATNKGFATGTNSITPTTFTSTVPNSYLMGGAADWFGGGTIASTDMTFTAKNDASNEVGVGYKSLGAIGSKSFNWSNGLGATSGEWHWCAAEITETVAQVPMVISRRTYPGAGPFRPRRFRPTLLDQVSLNGSFVDGDTGSATDAITTLAVTTSATETGAATESTSIAANLSVSDSATGSDAATVTVALTVTETGTGADAISVSTRVSSDADTAAGTEATSIAVITSVTDTGTGTESASVAVPISVTETGTGTETVSSLTADVSSSEIGTGTDSVSVKSMSATETGSSSDAVTLLASATVVETGTSVDAITNRTLATSETGVATDTAINGDRTVFVAETAIATDFGTRSSETAKNDTDSATAVDDVSLVASIFVSDSGTSYDEFSSLSTSRATADTASAADIVALDVSIALGENGNATEQLTSFARTGANDTAASVDAIASLNATLIVAETPVVSDSAAVAASLTSSDVGSSGDAIASLAAIAPSVADSMSYVEATFIAVTSSVSDTGTGTDSIAGKDMVVTEFATGAELASVVASTFTSDSGVGSEGTSVSVGISASDSGIASDFVAAFNRAVSDSAIALESAFVTAAYSVSDTGTVSDSGSLLASFMVADVASGIEFITAFAMAVGDAASASDAVLHVALNSTIPPSCTVTWRRGGLTSSAVVKVISAASKPFKYITSDGSITIIS